MRSPADRHQRLRLAIAAVGLCLVAAISGRAASPGSGSGSGPAQMPSRTPAAMRDEAAAATTTRDGCRVQAPNPTGPSFGVLFGDWFHREASSRFLSGCSPTCDDPKARRCVRRPSLHVPDSAPASELHLTLGDVDSRPFFRDAARGGQDLTSPWGLELANVIVFAGHGSAEHLETRPERRRLALDDVRVGDGATRYLLLLSCNVMAHGPAECPAERAGPPAYDCPELFADPGSAADRSVFSAWRRRLGPKLRLACGGATEILAEPAPARFWQSHLRHGMPVADAFVDSLAEGGQLGLCVTRGGADPRATALFDPTFTTAANPQPEGDAYLYALYAIPQSAAIAPIHTDLAPWRGEAGVIPAMRTSTARVERTSGGGNPALPANPPPADDWRPPILAVSPQPLHLTSHAAARSVSPTPSRAFVKRFPSLLWPADLGPGDSYLRSVLPNLELRVHARSGAIAASWNLPRRGGGGGDAITALLTLASALYPRLVAAATPGVAVERTLSAYSLRIDRVPEDSASDPSTVRCFTTCTVARMQSAVRVASPRDGKIHAVPIVGEGGEWLLRVCPAASGADGGIPPHCTPAGDGTATTSLIERQLTLVPAVDPTYTVQQPFATAREAAWADLAARLQQPASATTQFRPPKHQIVYLAAPLHCAQTRMIPVHRFTFTPTETAAEAPHSVAVDVPVWGEAAPEANWTCSEEWGAPPAADASAAVVLVQAMQKAVDHRRKDDAGDRQHGETAKDGVGALEELAGG